MSRIKRTVRFVSAIFVMAWSCSLLLSCSLASERGAREYLDERSAATITVAARPWTLARERPALAVNAREYLDLHAIEVNRSGEHRLYLLAHAWSTIDVRDRWLKDPSRLKIAADGRLIDLAPIDSDALALGIGATIVEPAGRNARVWYYSIEIEMLAYLAESSSVQARFEPDRSDDPYDAWRDGSQYFRSFIDRVR